MHHNADWLVWPIIIVLVLIWAGLLGAYATQQARRRREYDEASRDSFLETHREQMGYHVHDVPRGESK